MNKTAKTTAAKVDLTKFPPDVTQAARNAMKASGCPASVTLAQWAQESGYGHFLCAPNNPFGIKWYHGCAYNFVVHTTRECTDKTKNIWVTIRAKFIAFPDMETAFAFHGTMLMSSSPSSPYASAYQTWLKTHDPWKFVDQLAPRYATDPNYRQEIRDLMGLFDLIQFDKP